MKEESINKEKFQKETAFESNHEEADLRMLSHAKHASSSYEKILMSNPDTNFFAIWLSIDLLIDTNLFFVIGVKSPKPIVDVTAVADYTFKLLNCCETSKEILKKYFVSFHSFTWCDVKRAFAEEGKVKPLKLMLRDSRYVEAFPQLEEQTKISRQLPQIINSFVCHMYG